MAKQGFDPKWAEIFSEVTEHMRDWRREHPKATFRQIEREVEAQLARLRARMLTDVANASTAAEFAGQPQEERPTCPQCGVPVVARGKKRRAIRAHGDGEVLLERQHAACPKCGAAFFPSGH